MRNKVSVWSGCCLVLMRSWSGFTGLVWTTTEPPQHPQAAVTSQPDQTDRQKERWLVCLRTLGLGHHFGSTAPPAVHHRAADPSRAAGARPPGANATCVAWRNTGNRRIFERTFFVSFDWISVIHSKRWTRNAGREQSWCWSGWVRWGEDGGDLDGGVRDFPGKKTKNKSAEYFVAAG